MIVLTGIGAAAGLAVRLRRRTKIVVLLKTSGIGSTQSREQTNRRPVVLVGEGLGGAIVSGYGGDIVGPNLLTVSNGAFTRNDATGGDNNNGTASVAGLVGSGAGAAIANYAGGTAKVSGNELTYDDARGGHGNTAGGTGTVLANLGAGGGIFNYLGNYNSPPLDFGPLSASVVNVSRCVMALNEAQGLSGMGVGGGIADLLSATTTVDLSIAIQNEASGNGPGLGGGAYNDASSTLKLTNSFVTKNHANGSPGIGGGIYNLGTFTVDALTFIKGNHASTSNDNVFG